MKQAQTPGTARIPRQSNPTKPKDLEGNFELVEFVDVPEPMVAAHIPMQED